MPSTHFNTWPELGLRGRAEFIPSGLVADEGDGPGPEPVQPGFAVQEGNQLLLRAASLQGEGGCFQLAFARWHNLQQ